MGLSHSPKIVTDGLVLCLDAANKKSYPGSGTNWNDLSRYSNNGTLLNGAAINGNGSISFGSSVSNPTSLVSIPHNSSLSPGSNSFSVEFFLNMASLPTNVNSRLLIKGAIGISDLNLEYALYVSGTGYFSIATSTTGSSQTVNLSSNILIPINQWISLAFTKAGTTGNFYINGIFLDTKTVDAMLYQGSGNLSISNTPSIDRPFNGQVSSIKIYNRDLSAAEIQQNFNALRGRFGV